MSKITVQDLDAKVIDLQSYFQTVLGKFEDEVNSIKSLRATSDMRFFAGAMLRLLAGFLAYKAVQLRVISGTGYREDCQHCFRVLKILTLPFLYIFECLKYVSANINSFSRHSYIHHYNMRTADHFVIPFHRISATRSGITYYGPLLYNLMPDSVKTLPDYVLFGKVRSYLISQAFYSISECFRSGFNIP